MESISEQSMPPESSDSDIDSAAEEINDDQVLGVKMKKTGYGRVSGRIPCPAKSCIATRTLIQSLKQHIRESKGKDGHEDVFCLTCDSVFFTMQER